MSQLKLAYIGGMGLMASPSAIHLSNHPVAVVKTVHDRGTQSPKHNKAREQWQNHGSTLCATFAETINSSDIDGVVICCGKNGDDRPILSEVAQLLHEKEIDNPFIAHFSTVSTEFVDAATAFCRGKGIEYCNYPLTGGPLGSEAGGSSEKGMLILCSGTPHLYERLRPYLEVIGRPKFFGEEASKGAETKLIGHYLCFNGLIGISSALALHTEGFTGELGGKAQSEFFDFLNQGAGGTRQWEVASRKGIADQVWDQGFLLPHAVVDSLYAMQLCIKRKLPRIVFQPMLETALAFSYLLQEYPDTTLATHAIVREMLADTGGELDSFMNKHGRFISDSSSALTAVVQSLPKDIQESALLDVSADSFT